MSKWLEAKKIKGKFYIDSSDFSNIVKEYSDKITELEQENRKLKESLDIATKCSSKEEDGIIRLSEENKKLKHKNELQEKALIRLCLKHHYDSIIIEGEEVIDMSNYKVVEKEKPQEEKLF